MSREPFALDATQKIEVGALAAVLTVEQIADYFGIGRRTFYDLMARDSEIAAQYKKGKAKAIGTIANSLISKARSGNVTAMIFYLKCRAGWREAGALEPHDLLAPDDEPEAVSAGEKLKALLDRIADRSRDLSDDGRGAGNSGVTAPPRYEELSAISLPGESKDVRAERGGVP